MSSGFSCPDCGCKHSSVRNTKRLVWRGNEIIRRYRVCRHCGYTYVTKEQVNEDEPHRDVSSITVPAPPKNPFI